MTPSLRDGKEKGPRIKETEHAPCVSADWARSLIVARKKSEAMEAIGIRLTAPTLNSIPQEL